jgi:hypothetical protein
MSFQTILNIHQELTINNRRTIGQQYSRSGQVTVAQYLTTVPWVFTVKPHEFLYYPQVRDVIQAIDNADRQIPEYLTFNNSNLSWFTVMRGTATSATLAATPAPNAQTLSLSSNGTFKAGDFIQLDGYVYKITADSAGATVGIHRPVIGSPVSGAAVTMGNAVQFYMVAEKCPTYTLRPMANGAFVKWDSDFVFREYITG